MGNIDVFERIANNYDTPDREKIAKIIANSILKKISPQSSAQIAIDYGCGTGLVGMNLLDAFNTVIFADASQNMINIVKKKLEASSHLNAKTVCLDAENQPIQTVKLEANTIFMVQVLLHVKEITLLLNNLSETLPPKGQLIIVDFDYNEQVISDKVHNGFKEDKLTQTLHESGFENINRETFYHGKNMFMNKDASLFILTATKIG
ncbi:class I SAM-dependent methyltransferase [Brochothrix thermosphacta]|uniref:Methyltransferase type 12 n=1 Tax=Brochothrix thermosphacta TaxID=2756 RepID=A0A2X0S3E8_BROTH|nr:class I SAM-dependent methyltransferase [Brochothrix thermosphacta]SPP27272.1 Methyltransferase type 12 [Brochothrix thermosphacta]